MLSVYQAALSSTSLAAPYWSTTKTQTAYTESDLKFPDANLFEGNVILYYPRKYSAEVANGCATFRFGDRGLLRRIGKTASRLQRKTGAVARLDVQMSSCSACVRMYANDVVG